MTVLGRTGLPSCEDGAEVFTEILILTGFAGFLEGVSEMTSLTILYFSFQKRYKITGGLSFIPDAFMSGWLGKGVAVHVWHTCSCPQPQPILL